MPKTSEVRSRELRRRSWCRSEKVESPDVHVSEIGLVFYSSESLVGG